MPLCKFHNREMKLWTPNKGPAAYTCSVFIGQGEQGANANGYCSYRVPATQPASEVAPGSPNGGGARSESDPRSARLQAAIAALQASSRIVGTEEEVINRAAVYYHSWLKPAFFGEPPAPKAELPPPPASTGWTS